MKPLNLNSGFLQCWTGLFWPVSSNCFVFRSQPIRNSRFKKLREKHSKIRLTLVRSPKAALLRDLVFRLSSAARLALGGLTGNSLAPPLFRVRGLSATAVVARWFLGIVDQLSAHCHWKKVISLAKPLFLLLFVWQMVEGAPKTDDHQSVLSKNAFKKIICL